MTQLEVIPSEEAAREALQKIEMVRCLSLLEAYGLTASQLRLTISDKYYSVARKIVKAYVKQAFPSGSIPRVLTRHIKLDMNPVQSRICLGLYSYRDTYRYDIKLLRFIEPVRVALEAFHQSLQTYRSYLYVQTNAMDATYYVNANPDEFIRKRGSLKEYLVGILNAIKVTKDALDNVILAIGDYDQSLEIGRELMVIHDEQERLRQANAVADICTKLTGIGYGPFATVDTTAPDTIPETVSTVTGRVSVAPRRSQITVEEAPNTMDIAMDIAFQEAERQRLAGRTAERIVIDEMATMPRFVFRNVNAPVTPIPPQEDAPAEPRIRDINGNAVRPAEPELQERLNQILREQGVVR